MPYASSIDAPFGPATETRRPATSNSLTSLSTTFVFAWSRTTRRSAGAIRPSGMIPSHLVQQRLEQVVVRAIDDRYVDVYLGEFAGDIHASETAPTTTTLGRPPP